MYEIDGKEHQSNKYALKGKFLTVPADCFRNIGIVWRKLCFLSFEMGNPE